MAENDVKLFIKGLQKRIDAQWDAVCAFTGEEGVGKSTLMILLAMMVDKKFDLEKNVSYLPSYDEVINKFNSLDMGSVYIIDEAIKVLDKQQWTDELQRAIRQMYATERKQRKITFLGMPRFSDLAERFRNHRVKYWFHVVGRGRVIAFIRDDDKDCDDPWHRKDNQKLKKQMFGKKQVVDKDVKDIIAIERKTPNYWFDFTFDPLPPEIDARYNELVKKYKEQAAAEEKEEEFTENNKVWLGRLCAALKERGKMNVKEMSEIMMCSEDAVSRRIQFVTGLKPNELRIRYTYERKKPIESTTKTISLTV